MFHKARTLVLLTAADCTATADNSITGVAIKDIAVTAEISGRRMFIFDSQLMYHQYLIDKAS